MSEPKYRYRVPPCASCDIPAMESWLEDMAAKGLHLSHDGFFWGFASFEEGPPRREKFRLEPTTNNGGLLSDEYSPDADAVEMNGRMGWTYRARRGQFHIYSSADPDAPELNTDPQVQAITMAALTKQLRRSLLETLIVAVLDYFLLFSDVLLSAAVVFGTGKVLLLMVLLLWDLLRSIRTIVVLGRYCRQLRNGAFLPHRSDYRKNAWRYPLAGAVRAASWVVLIGCFLCSAGSYITEEDRIPLEEYTDPLPFATISDFYPGAVIEPQSGFLDSTVAAWSDFLAPENYDYSEYAEVTLNGERFDCYLTLNFHRTRWSWTAAALAREFAAQEHDNAIEAFVTEIFDNEPFTVTPLTVPGADYACCYSKYGTEPHLVLQRGNWVIRVQLDVLGQGHQIGVEELAKLVLSHIR